MSAHCNWPASSRRQLTAQDAAANARASMAAAAGQRPDPVLKAGIDNLPITAPDRFSLTRDFMTMRSIGVMQEFTRADKRKRARGALRARGRSARDAQRARALVELRRDTAHGLARAPLPGTHARAAAAPARRERGCRSTPPRPPIAAAAARRPSVRRARGGRADRRPHRASRARRSRRRADALARWVGAAAARRRSARAARRSTRCTMRRPARRGSTPCRSSR